MPDYEDMADGYKAHLFEDFKGNFGHLRQCGCWICSYRRQQLQRECYPVADNESVADDIVTTISLEEYWGDS